MLKYNYQYLVDMYCTYAVHLIISTMFISMSLLHILTTREECHIERDHFLWVMLHLDCVYILQTTRFLLVIFPFIDGKPKTFHTSLLK